MLTTAMLTKFATGSGCHGCKKDLSFELEINCTVRCSKCGQERKLCKKCRDIAENCTSCGEYLLIPGKNYIV